MSFPSKRSVSRRRWCFGAATALSAAFVLSSTHAAVAAPNLTIEPITWDVVGLDSNNQDDGPNKYPVAARVCNTGDQTATDVTTTFLWDTDNPYLNLESGTLRAVGDIVAGDCRDVYYNVIITRDATAIGTFRGYHIEVVADGVGVVSTPTPRQLFVEGVINQNRNSVTDGLTGPTQVVVGQQYTYVVEASTAPGGYEQISAFVDFPESMFEVISVDTAYTSPAGATSDSVYADACGWDLDPTSATYRSCIGPENYTGGKAGNGLTITYVIEVIDVGTSTVATVITDVSGNSYHYNTDYGSAPGILTIVATALPDLAAQKTDELTVDADGSGTVTIGDTLTYTISLINNGLGDATAVTFTDTPDPLTTLVNGSVSSSQGSVTSGNTAGDGSVVVDLGTVPPGGSATITFDVVITGSGTQVLNQGTFTYPAGPDVVTDDPEDLTSTNDPTITPVEPTLTPPTTAPPTTTPPTTAPPTTAPPTTAPPTTAPPTTAPPTTAPPTFAPTNNPPVAIDDGANTTPNTPVVISVLSDDFDPNGDAITVTEIVTPAGNGTTTINPDGTITYTPNDWFYGIDTFVYRICEPAGLCDTATVTVVTGLPATGSSNGSLLTIGGMLIVAGWALARVTRRRVAF